MPFRNSVQVFTNSYRLHRILNKGSFIKNEAVALRMLLTVDALILFYEMSSLVILPWWVVKLGGVDALAIFSAVLAAVTFLSTLVVSPFGDRFSKRTQILLAVVALCVVAGTLTVLGWKDQAALPSIIFFSAVQVLAVSFIDPARETAIAEMLPASQLAAAIRARKLIRAAIGILAPLFAGITLHRFGTFRAFGVCTASLLISLPFAYALPSTISLYSVGRGAFAWCKDIQQGLQARWQMPMERGWVLVNFMVWIFQGPAVGLLIPLKVQALGLGGNWFGAALGALSIGSLLGSAAGAQILVKRLGRYRVRVGVGVMEGIAFILVGLAHSPGALLGGLAAAGFCNASMSLVGATHRALAVPKAYRVRFYATSAMTTQIAGAIGPALVAVALRRCSIELVYPLWGLLMSFSILAFMRVPRFAEFLTLDHDQVSGWYESEYPTIFQTAIGETAASERLDALAPMPKR